MKEEHGEMVRERAEASQNQMLELKAESLINATRYDRNEGALT